MPPILFPDDKGVHFIGFLTNTDASILQLGFDYGFKIEALTQREAIDFVEAIGRGPGGEAARIISMRFPLLNFGEKQVYVISNSLEGDPETDEMELFNKIARFDNKSVHGYLHPRLRLIRLFKEGDLRMPLKYYYTLENGGPSSYMSGWSSRYISQELCHIESSELQDLSKFLSETKIPFERAFLQLAFENFELSYEIPNIALSFLTLMIGLEALLNPGERELKYRVSRNAAVLLGNGTERSRRIFSEIKKLYDKRSRVVHTGQSKIIKKEHVLKLRHYVRESIKKMYKMRKSKDDILGLLDSHGFGEGVKS